VPTGPVRAQKKLDKRERIRAAAWELFTTVGFEETRTKDVAERAGIATGTLFLYAPDKVDLLCLVMHDRLVSATEGAFLTLPKRASLVDQLLHVFRAVFEMYAEHPKVSHAFVRAVQGADGPNGREVGAMTFAFMHRLAGLVQDGVQRGEVAAEVSPVLAAQVLFGLYFFTVTTFLSGYTSMEAALDPMLRSGFELIMKGLAPRG
jgi:AcrR family transcriptional regulator